MPQTGEVDLGAVLPPRQVMAARGLTYSGSGNTGIACSTYASYELEIPLESYANRHLLNFPNLIAPIAELSAIRGASRDNFVAPRDFDDVPWSVESATVIFDFFLFF